MNEKDVNTLVVGYLQSIGSPLATKVKKSLGVADLPTGSPSLKDYLNAGNEVLSSPALKKTKAKVNGCSPKPQLNGKAKNKGKPEESSSEDSSSEEEKAPVTKKPVAKKPQKEESSESSSEEEQTKKKAPTPAAKSVAKAAEESSGDSSDESEAESAPKKQIKKPVQTKPTKKESSDEESSSEDEEPAKPAAKAPVAKPQSKEESSDESSSEEDEAPAKKPVAAKAKQPVKAQSKEESSDEESSSEEEETPAKKPAQTKGKPAAKPQAEESSDDSSSEEEEEAPAKKPAPTKSKPAAKPAKEESSDDESSSEEDEAPAKKPAPTKNKPAVKAQSKEESSSEDESSEEEEAKPVPKKEERGVKRAREEEVSTPPQKKNKFSQDSAEENETNQLFMAGTKDLAEDALNEYFSQYKNLVSCRLAKDRETNTSRGFGFIEFESVEGAKNVLADGFSHNINGVNVNLRFSQPKGDNNRKSGGFGSDNGFGNKRKSFGNDDTTNEVFLQNIGSLGEDDISNHFGQYGNIERCRVPTDRETGESRGFAFVTYSSNEEAAKAVQESGNNVEINGQNIWVRAARAKTDDGGRGGTPASNVPVAVLTPDSSKKESYRRVREEDFNVDPRFNNSYEAKKGRSDDWGAKAHKDLKVVKGKRFVHEKNKKKRGSYKGGKIDTGINSIRFED